MNASVLRIGLASVLLLLLGGCSTTSPAGSSESSSMAASSPSTSDATLVRAVQQSLTAQGYPVDVDGKWGPATQSALLKFQMHRGLAETGQLDQPTLTALGVSS